jgi:hypothetical protein
MFTSVAVVTHVQKSDENNRFYAQAELILAQDVSQARLELEDVNYSVMPRYSWTQKREEMLLIFAVTEPHPSK